VLDIYSEPSYKLSVREDARRIWRLLRHLPDPQTEILNDLHPDMPREVLPIAKAAIHHTVFDRVVEGTDRYAPVVVPAHYRFIDDAGTAIDGLYQPPDQGRSRSHVQDDVWNWVWLRRVVYFLTVFATAFIAFIPYWVIYAPGFGLKLVGGFVNPIVNTAASFLPAFLDPWFVAFRNAPGFVLIGAVGVVCFMAWGAALQQKVRDVARIAWHSPQGYQPLTGWRRLVYKLRRRGEYRAAFYLLTHWILPAAIMWWLFWWLAFGTANTLGLFCKPTGHGIDVTGTEIFALKSAGYSEKFETSNLCYPTGLKVTHGETYQINIAVTEPWTDHGIPAGPEGFAKSTWKQLGGVPFKRLIWSNWFAPIVRVGGAGLEEHLPTFKQASPGGNVWSGEFIARSDGEVFVYVNDTSIFLPWLLTYFYGNNEGKAVISLKKM